MQRNPGAFFLMAVMFYLCGALLVYRVYHTDDTLVKINGTVMDKQLSTTGGAHPRYAMDFTFLEGKAVYGIDLGTEANESAASGVDVGKKYTFYIDPTVPADEYGKQAGIRVIMNGSVVVYRKAYKYFIAGAIAFVAIGTILLIAYYSRMRSLSRLQYRVVRRKIPAPRADQ